MEKKSVYATRDGRRYDVVMSWNEKIKDSENVFPIKFTVTDKSNSRLLKLPREIATFAIGDPAENIGERAQAYFGGNRDIMFIDYLESAFRRACDYVERGK